MKDSSRILFKFLLLIYPPFVLWSQGGMLLINQIIGGAIGLIIACIWLLKKRLPSTATSRDAMAFGISILISFALSNWSSINLIVLVKYFTALLVITFSNQYLSAEFLSKILRFLFFFMLVVIVGRTLTFGDIGTIMLVRDSLWWGKPVLFAQMYLPGMLHYLHRTRQSKNYYIRMLGAVSILGLFGSRAILLVALFIITFESFRLLRIPRIVYLLTSLTVVLFGVYNFDQGLNYATVNTELLSVIGSQRDLAGISEVTINSLSSGRLQILEAYVADYDLWQFLFGRGGISPAIGFSTHNDFLDVLFFYGFPSLLLFLKFFWRSVLHPLFSSGTLTLITILVIETFNPVFTSATYLYILLLVSYISKKEQCQ